MKESFFITTNILIEKIFQEPGEFLFSLSLHSLHDNKEDNAVVNMTKICKTVRHEHAQRALLSLKIQENKLIFFFFYKMAPIASFCINHPYKGDQTSNFLSTKSQQKM